jgi:hypothetical protein
MMIERHTLALIAILVVHFGSQDIAAAGDEVQKSSCRKFNQIGNDKRASSDRQSMARSRLHVTDTAYFLENPFLNSVRTPKEQSRVASTKCD